MNGSAPQSGRRTSRRAFLAAAGATVAAAAAGGTAAAAGLWPPGAAGARPAQDTPTPHVRPLPAGGGEVPLIGLGSFMTFDRRPETDRSFIPAVLQEFFDGGGRVVDTSALYGASEANVGEFARELGLTDRLFLTDKSWNCGEYAFDDSHTLRQFRRSQQRLHRDRIDVVGIHSMTNVGMVLPVLRRLKEEGQIRYVGLTSHEPYQYAGMVRPIQSGLVDFIQIRYSLFERSAEERLLPLAADHGVAVMVNMPLEKGRLHHVVGDRPLPDFARERGCASWAEFFLSYVAAHPAVTCVIPATTEPEHVRENLATMYRPLPDEAERAEMLRFMQDIPGFAGIGDVPWYPGKTFTEGLVRLPQPHPAGGP
ncbi:MAG TPA: aldo/keto reductase [Pseudonocardia sp.]|jgi:diketogulonate reductase-like aldo/keto reductase|uniref:aldo/keto reductase n=1 Tax=Pseudonocardia sp. TaxID=60912 RepID=UPI002B4B895A|nr:aldo/keto reductase [Pseudonocardia sp.]HLU54679.1 aldo/keto reductase [Pseudonocardia sp.]